MWSLCVPILSKVDQKRNWVKLKSVRTLLRIEYLADKKSYVIIICASLLGQVEIDLTFKCHPMSKVMRSTEIP